jgi:hypothetical protein
MGRRGDGGIFAVGKMREQRKSNEERSTLAEQEEGDQMLLQSPSSQ